MARESERISLGQIMAAGLLVLAALVLFFYHLGKTNLSREVPAKIAVYASQMNAAGEWAAPVVRGQARVDVPPLYLWSTKVFSFFSQDVTAFQERFPAALSALALVLLGAWWLYRHAERYSREDQAEASPEGFALLAGLILVTNPVLYSMARGGTLHTMFVLFYIAAAFCWSESLEARRSFYAGQPWRRWVLWGYFFAGVAMLARGPLVLPLLWVPYLLAARSYHLRRPDWVHGAGLLLALALGLSWPLAVTLYHPAAAPPLWRSWLTLLAGNLDTREASFYTYLMHIAISSFPWNILAVVLAVRVWRRVDRSPTLVFWMCSLVGNLLVLTFLSSYAGQHRLPVIVFISLLAADAIYRWNFEHPWATAWRVLLRVILVGFIGSGIVIALLLKTSWGLALFLLIPLAWAAWAIRSRLHDVSYTPWETALRLAGMVICVLFVAEAVLLADYEPKRSFYDDRLAYFVRITDRLDQLRPAGDPKISFFNADISVLYNYYVGSQPVLSQPAAQLRAAPGRPTVLFADHDQAKGLLKEPNLEGETFLWNGDHTQVREGMFRVASGTAATSATTTTLPWRVVLLGNQGTRSKDQERVARQINRSAGRQAVNDALLLGNNLFGPSLMKRLDIIAAFEKPYRNLLFKRGVTFHAALGREDQSMAWAQLHYPPFNMGGRRYYTFTTGPGTIDVFLLDGERLHAGGKFDEPQLAWLEGALKNSQTPWKIVGLSQPLASTANGDKVDMELTARLLPLFDRYKVSLVAWAGGMWYERLALPDHKPLFLNAGWSGKSRTTTFYVGDPRRKVGYSEHAGFVALDFYGTRAVLNATNDEGEIIDLAEVAPSGVAVALPIPKPTPVPGLPAASPGAGREPAKK